MTAFERLIAPPIDSQDGLPIGVHARRIMARLHLAAAFRTALEIDPSIKHDLSLLQCMMNNADLLAEEYQS